MGLKIRKKVKPKNSFIELRKTWGTSLVVEWIKNPPANAEDMGLIPGPGRFHMRLSN